MEAFDKPDVDAIEGLSPAISIDQKSTSHNPRSTVGTVTEIHDYLRLLWARIGVPFCAECGEKIVKQTPQQIVDQILEMPEGTRFQLLAQVVDQKKGEFADLFRELSSQGFARAVVDGETGFLVNGNDLRQITERIIELLLNPQRASQMGAAGRDWVKQQWTWDLSFKRLDALLSGIDPH